MATKRKTRDREFLKSVSATHLGNLNVHRYVLDFSETTNYYRRANKRHRLGGNHKTPLALRVAHCLLRLIDPMVKGNGAEFDAVEGRVSVHKVINYAFLTNADFSPMDPMPSILQSIS